MGTLTVMNSDITGNTAVRAGGGIEVASGGGMNILTNVNLSNNSTGSAPGNGGGLHITGSDNSMITGGTINNNMASAEGGGLWNGSGMMTVDGATIDGNTASGASADQGGGGIFNAGGTLMVQNGTTISNNVANGAAGSGGGILNDLGTLTASLQSAGLRTHIETSGAHPSSGNWDWFCLSPKKFVFPRPESYKMADELKVIVFNESDFKWAREEAEKVSENCVLLLQPEWSREKQMLPLIVDFVKANPRCKPWNPKHTF